MNLDEVKAVIAKKVTGKVIACHDEKGHHYLIGKKLVDSVTTKLILEKPHLVKWAVKIGFEWMETRWQTMNAINRDSYLDGAVLAHTELRDFAGDVGHQVHEILENWANEWIRSGTRPPDIRAFIPAGSDFRVTAGARSGESVFIKSNCIPVSCELLVGSKKYNSAGTLDILVYNPEKDWLELWDYKSSNQVSDPYAIQVAAYKKFFELMTKLKIGDTKVLHLSKDYDKFTLYKVPYIEDAFKAFIAISKVYDWRENGRKKLERDIKVITI